MDECIRKTLDQIKWLLVLQLQNQGVASKDIAKVIGVDPSVISRKVPRQNKHNRGGEGK